MHAYSFAKFIFLRLEMMQLNSPIQEYLDIHFFAEVWLSLIQRPPSRRLSGRTAAQRAFILEHLQEYLALSNHTMIPLLYSQQASLYEGERIATNYINNIKHGFGDQLRHAVNVLLDVKQRVTTFKKTILGQQPEINEAEMQRLVREQLTGPATRFKMAISRRTTAGALMTQFGDVGPEFPILIKSLRPFLQCYPDDYEFQQGNIYYDCKANPAAHFKACIQLARILETAGQRPFHCFPLRRSWAPGYVTIDTKILQQNIIGSRWLFQ